MARSRTTSLASEMGPPLGDDHGRDGPGGGPRARAGVADQVEVAPGELVVLDADGTIALVAKEQ
jgi:hypothetical protein